MVNRGDRRDRTERKVAQRAAQWQSRGLIAATPKRRGHWRKGKAATRPALRERRANRFETRAWVADAFAWRWDENDLIIPDFALAADVEEYGGDECGCCCCTGECAAF